MAGKGATILLLVSFLLVGSKWVLSSPAGGSRRAARPPRPMLYHANLLQEYVHDPTAFTQGLEYDTSCPPGSTNPQDCTEIFWESTGMNGQSSVRQVNLKTGQVIRSRSLPQSDFGEGLVKSGNRLIQILWLTNKAYSYAADDFNDRQEVRTPLQDGWGITTDNTSLILSDGSSTLTWVNPQTLQKERSLEVKDGTRSVHKLNELEYIDGEIWANIWQTECIARINPETGLVTAWVLLLGLREKLLQQANQQGLQMPYGMDVLNGIAYDKVGRRIFITGKYWPRVFEIELQPGTETRPAQVEQARAECIPR